MPINPLPKYVTGSIIPKIQPPPKKKLSGHDFLDNLKNLDYDCISNGQKEISQKRYNEFWGNKEEFTKGIYNAYDTDKSGGLSREEFEKLKADLVNADQQIRGGLIKNGYWEMAIKILMKKTNEDNGESYTYLDIAKLTNELLEQDDRYLINRAKSGESQINLFNKYYLM